LLALPGAEGWATPDGAEGRAPRILVVDDDSSNVRLLTRSLHRVGFSEVEGTTDPFQAFRLFCSFSPDLILLDLHMPGLDGMSLLEQVRAVTPPDAFLPILIITGDLRPEPRREALARGATDFLIKPFDPIEVVLRVRNILATRALHLMLQYQNRRLENRVAARTRELEQAQLEGLERLAVAAEFRDDTTGRHTIRVATLAATLAEALHLPAANVDLIRKAAPLHDVGKIGVPDQILLKPGALSLDEAQVMRTHATIGARILGGGRSMLMQMAERIARSHHERWDGTGYPDHLAGEAIPLEARVIAVADSFDALTHTRPYRTALPLERAREEIVAYQGRYYDPTVVEAFLALPEAQSIVG
jgi:putative two-component system response regulator